MPMTTARHDAEPQRGAWWRRLARIRRPGDRDVSTVVACSVRSGRVPANIRIPLVVIGGASNTTARTPSRPAMRLQSQASCAKSGPITRPRFGDGRGPDARSCASQALAASMSWRRRSGLLKARLTGLAAAFDSCGRTDPGVSRTRRSTIGRCVNKFSKRCGWAALLSAL